MVPANCWAWQARHECSVRELVDIHKRELMASLMESAQKRAETESFYDCPRDTARAAWQYEHIRGFSIELSELAVALKDACTVETCPQMKATDEWMYLCAAHKQPQECCAIDYIVHTLDGTAALLNSNKWFPRRGGAVPEASFKYFQSITRRLYRILSHCYFHHRDVFDVFEQQRHLCFRFVCFAQVGAYFLNGADWVVISCALMCVHVYVCVRECVRAGGRVQTSGSMWILLPSSPLVIGKLISTPSSRAKD